jgi:hypothetical protein
VVALVYTQAGGPVEDDVNSYLMERAMSAKEREVAERFLARWRRPVQVAQIQESPGNMADEVVFPAYPEALA